jgi:hypothetical protein
VKRRNNRLLILERFLTKIVVIANLNNKAALTIEHLLNLVNNVQVTKSKIQEHLLREKLSQLFITMTMYLIRLRTVFKS